MNGCHMLCYFIFYMLKFNKLLLHDRCAQVCKETLWLIVCHFYNSFAWPFIVPGGTTGLSIVAQAVHRAVCVSGRTGGFNYVYVVDNKVIQTSLQFMLLNPGHLLWLAALFVLSFDHDLVILIWFFKKIGNI